MTQQQVADLMARIGYKIHRSTVGKIESGDRPVSVGEAVQLSAILGIDLRELITDPPEDDERRTAQAAFVTAQMMVRSSEYEHAKSLKALHEARDACDRTKRQLADAKERESSTWRAWQQELGIPEGNDE